MFFMRYQSLLFSGLLISAITSPYAQADTTADLIRKNQRDVERYQRDFERDRNNQNKRSTQEDTKLIIAAYKAMDEEASAASNQKVHNEVMKIQITGRIATVNVRATAIAKYSTSVSTGEDIWQRNNNGWKYVRGRVFSSNTTANRPRTNSTGQAKSHHDVIQASNLADQAIRGCYEQKNLEECDKLHRIESTLSTWCQQGDQNACSIWMSVENTERSMSFNQQLQNP
jgi:hypothetical protein